MQIYELTRPRRVNEGFASALGTQLMNKAFGGVDVMDKSGPAQSREQGFQSMVNSPAARTLAVTMQKSWQETVQNFLVNSKDASGNPPTSLSQVTRPSVTTLRPTLDQMVNSMIGRQGTDYKQLATYVADPLQKQYTQKIVTDIDNTVDAIYQATLKNADPGTVGKMFVELVGMGVLPAQNIIAYDRGSVRANKTRLYKDPDGRRVIDLGRGPEWFDDKNPEHIRVRDEYLKGTAKT
jgi:uncharacterized protein YheU (UPF0270 family)